MTCNKMAYQSKQDAIADYKLLIAGCHERYSGKSKMYAYLCHCGMWHLTRQKQKGKLTRRYRK